MNTLIIGGLLVIGVLALVGVVFLIRSEPGVRATPDIRPQTPTQVEKSEPQVNRTVAGPPPALQARPVPAVVPAPMRPEEQPFPVANGQFHELSVQLRTLHQQAQELEHRLSILTDMIDHIEQSQYDRTGIEDEATSSLDTPPIR